MLFLYGTLRPGGSRWDLLRPAADSVRPARVEGALYRTGRGFPAARFDRSGTVHGVVVEAPEEVLPLLDEVEGVEGGLFRRVRITVRADGEELEAWSYEYAREPSEEDRIPGGDWLADRRGGT